MADADVVVVEMEADETIAVTEETVERGFVLNEGPAGDDGDSAYAVAVANGFVGSEAEWLDSLVGADGSGGSGSRVLYGDGVPDPSLGVQSDSYVDRLTGNLYRKWSKPASWPWTPAGSEDPDLAAGVGLLLPAWEGAGQPKEWVSGDTLTRVGGCTWATQQGVPVLRFDGTGYLLCDPVIQSSTVYTYLIITRSTLPAPPGPDAVDMALYEENLAGGTAEGYIEPAFLFQSPTDGPDRANVDSDTWLASSGLELFTGMGERDMSALTTLMVRRNGSDLRMWYKGQELSVQPPPNNDNVVVPTTNAVIGIATDDGVTYTRAGLVGDIAGLVIWPTTALTDEQIESLALDPLSVAREAGADLMLEPGYWVLEAELATQAELDALAQTVADFPLPPPILAKPAPWNWSADKVSEMWSGILAKCVFLAPLWEGPGELPYDLISGEQGANRVVGLTPSWTVQDGLVCQDGASGGHWAWESPPLPAIDQPVSILHVVHGATSFVGLPNLLAESFGSQQANCQFEYAPTTSPTESLGTFLDGEPSHGSGWRVMVNGVIARGVPAPFAINGLPPLSGAAICPDDGNNPTWTTLAPSIVPLRVGLADNPGIPFVGSFFAMAAIFSPALTQDEANLVSGDPFGLVRPVVPAGGTTGQVLTKATGDDYDAGWATPAVTQAELDAEASTRDAADTALDGRLDSVELTAPTAGEKAALAGTSGTPGSGNKYVTDGDARNTNTRTPTAHTHPESDVTNLVTDLAGKIPATEKGAASGVATLDGGGKVPSAQLPAVALVKPTVVADLAARLALSAEAGDVAVQTDTTKTYMLKEAGDPTVDADWIELKAPSGGAPAGSPYVTFGTDATLSNERVITDTATVAWDIATAGQVKANVPDNAVTNAKAADMATATMKGRKTAGTGDPEDLSAADARTNMGLGSLATVSPTGTPDGTKFLRDDNSWQAAPGGSVEPALFYSGRLI